jgi:ABC-type nitrate/sulfonate/bicarbonate transport system permease component
MIGKFFRPFEETSKSHRLYIIAVWVVMVLLYWILSSNDDKNLFPTPGQVGEAFKGLFSEGLKDHLGSSLSLFFKSMFIALFVSLGVVYLSPIPFLRPLSLFLSRLRYLPLAGFTYYAAVIIKDVRTMQVWVLVIFMSLYFITSLLSVLSDIPQEEYDHARSLKCTRWEMLWEVVIKGRIDYVIEVLRQNLSIIWMMLVAVESLFIGTGGLGVLIKNSEKFSNHGRIVAIQIIILIIGLLFDWLLYQLRKIFFRYSKF